jgi:hypothetical protein
MQARFNRNLIIDGHGKELTGTTFDFRRAQGNECDLYCYVRIGIGIGVTTSNQIIQDAINGNISREISESQLSSRIGGTLVTDKQLHAIQLTATGPQWNNDALFIGGISRNININGVNGAVAITEIVSGNNTYVRLPFDSNGSIKLSEIINHYNAGQYNILWTVCRVE